MMLEAVEKRFGATRAPMPSNIYPTTVAHTLRERPRLFAQALNLIPCSTPVASLASPRRGGSIATWPLRARTLPTDGALDLLRHQKRETLQLTALVKVIRRSSTS